MAIAPNPIAGGDNAEATIELNGVAATGGQIVFLQASTSAVTVPASIKVPAGYSSYSFILKTTAVNSNTPTTVTATIGSGSQTGSVTVLPAGPSELIVEPTVQGGTSEEVGVFLASPAGSSGVTVALSSNNAAVVTPASIKVPSGYSSYWYQQKTSGVNTTTAVKITATVGSASVSATTSLTPSTLSSLTLSRGTVAAGGLSAGTVVLTGPAGPSGTVVNFGVEQQFGGKRSCFGDGAVRQYQCWICGHDCGRQLLDFRDTDRNLREHHENGRNHGYARLSEHGYRKRELGDGRVLCAGHGEANGAGRSLGRGCGA